MLNVEALPLPALVGLDAAQQALLLLAVEPRLRGVVLAAAAGSGKSSLAYGFRALHETLPFVELPLHADEESLLGGLDIEATLRTGARVLRPGVLARADGGVLGVDGLNLLPDASANLLLAALDSGEVRLEREGLSVRHPASFAVLACYDPAEGVPRRHVLDRIGLLVVLPATGDATQRAEIVRRNLRPGGQRWDDEMALLRGLVLAAREQLPRVTISDEQITQLVGAAVEVGVEGQRAELFAVRAAQAAAALALRDTVEPEDLELAFRLVILPRATRLPSPQEEPPPSQPEAQPEADQPPPSPGATTTPEQQPADANGDDGTSDDATSATPPTLEDLVLSALATSLPLDLNDLPFRTVRRGRSGSRGSTEGRRGRHVRSTSGDPRRARIDIAATLRTAAPWQRIRGEQRAESREQRTENKGTRTENQEPRTENQGSPFHPPSLAQKTPLHPSERRSPIIQADDLRVKRFRSKASTLFCFAVDASGSMAVHRMRQAKGAVHALLQQAYVHRDRVALLSFRGSEAELLLPPSQSVELARRALDLLPTGGGTPLAAALLSALTVADQARSRGVMQTVLVLLTDGRANIGLRGQRADIPAELQQIARQVVAAGIRTVVVDTQRSYLSRGEARQLAGWLAGSYVYLPNARGEQIADLALAAKGQVS